jgi:hypothetical protein
MAAKKQSYIKQRYLYYWLWFISSYVFPFVYFLIKLGVTQQTTKIVMPVVILFIIAVFRISIDIPRWVETWQPSFKKGIIKSIPKILLFVILITLGLTLKHILRKQIDIAFTAYFETVIVLFGGMTVGSIFGAYHLKYKELYLIENGYVLGVVNRVR